MKQTAVEWYEKEINSLFEKYEAKEISKRDFITMKHNLFYQAKEMEKQQIIDSISNANKSNNRNVSLNPEQYYNETFYKE
jgi:DNA-directed RNA polymerase delta subunit